MHRVAMAVCLILLPLFHGYTGLAESGSSQARTIPIYPVTSGRAYAPERPMARVLIAGPDGNPRASEAVAAAKEVFHRGGMVVLEESVPRTLAMPQGPRLPEHGPVDPGLLAFGKEAGADHLILIDVTDTLMPDQPVRGTTGYLHDEQVVVRGVSVDSGATVIEGTARWSQPVERPGQHIRQLTAYAIARALCAPDKWEEASAHNNGRGKCRN